MNDLKSVVSLSSVEDNVGEGLYAHAPTGLGVAANPKSNIRYPK